MKNSYKRRRKLIKPRLQLLSALVILSTAGCYVLLQAILMNWTVSSIVDSHPEAGQEVMPALMGSMRLSLLLTFLVLVPVSLVVGVLMTFRVAGPVYRFETYLKQVIAGEDPGPCRIRREDELQELCELISQATAPVRETARAASADEPHGASDVDEPKAPLGSSGAPSEAAHG